MSNTAEELKDTLNDIERDVYDGIDLGDMFTKAYVLADELGESIDKLREESAKLREQIDAAHMSRLLTENENELLRELLIDVSEEVPWSFMDTTKYCMPLRADKLRKLLCRMRELGVEVDGWAK